MRITYRQALPSLCVLVCLAVPRGARATDEEEVTTSQLKAAATEEMPPGDTIATTENSPAKFNKASGIIGMDVRNQDNEPLGHIKDIVFDLKTERVAYAVLNRSSKDLLSLKDRLLAVPLSALTPSADQKHLVLKADKSRVETAMGFDPDHWPSATSPLWGAEPLWQQDSEKAAVDEPESETTMTDEMEPDPEMGIDDPEAPPTEDPEAPPKPDSQL